MGRTNAGSRPQATPAQVSALLAELTGDLLRFEDSPDTLEDGQRPVQRRRSPPADAPPGPRHDTDTRAVTGPGPLDLTVAAAPRVRGGWILDLRFQTGDSRESRSIEVSAATAAGLKPLTVR